MRQRYSGKDKFKASLGRGGSASDPGKCLWEVFPGSAPEDGLRSFFVLISNDIRKNISAAN